ncbi:MAG: transposase [Candidatus Heimdallarchaeota archaeon]|nr:IS200/IS605 family element transposase accessory protein TnpB [Candidatus Heimdallarchaeota archaeon]MCG3257352.1 transposase [Candidatus Heimdallarchaeota archaeon]MCK4612407.1 transposase [Candidatus Heimdallarchaeota archaeon]
MVEVLRVECIEVKYHQALSTLCHQVKNLYNRANYLVKTAWEKDGKLPYYYNLNSILNHETCYRVLPVHTAQHTLKLLTRNWKGYFEAKKEWRKKPSNFFAMPRPPNYKAKDGEVVAILTNQQARIVNGWLILPKKVPFFYKTRLTCVTKLQEVRIVPRRVGYTIELVYQKTIPKPRKKSKRKGAIDLGMVNLVTFVDNLGNRPIVVKDTGKGIKSITQYYLKKQTQLRAQYVQQQLKQLKQKNRLRYGPAYYKLREDWRKKMKDSLHKLTRFLIDLWVERELDEVNIGYNPMWKHKAHFSKKITQMFVTIPYLKFIKLLKYKAADVGIIVETIPEEYTSKCSFLDNEFPEKHQNYAGQRVTRGLFKSSLGIYINADVNAAFNILLKSDPQALPPRSVGGVGGYVMYPLRVSLQAMNL